MRGYRQWRGTKDRVPDDWHKKILWLWVEDDAGCPDAESLFEAYARITKTSMTRKDSSGKSVLEYVASIDFGDAELFLQQEGWVLQRSYRGNNMLGMFVLPVADEEIIFP